MRFQWSFLAVFMVASGCASSGSAPPTASWPAGEYELEATVRYAQDSQASGAVGRETYYADLTVSPEGELTLDTTSGLCLEPLQGKYDPVESAGYRVLECGNAIYRLRPASGQTVSGSVEAEVLESRRVQVCVRYSIGPDGARTCARYTWTVESDRTVKTAPIRVRQLASN